MKIIASAVSLLASLSSCNAETSLLRAAVSTDDSPTIIDLSQDIPRDEAAISVSPSDGESHAASTSNRIPCPYFRQGKPGEDRLPSHKTTHERRKEWEKNPHVKELHRKYTPGKMNEGETFCSSDNEHKFCNKMHGDWGDSIPQTGEYCIWGILEFEDPEGFFDDPARDAMFSAIFQNEVCHLSEDEDLQDKWLFAAGTGGIGGGDFSAPWPYSSIVWKNGNEFAKQFISDRHRINAQEPGLGMGWTFHGHYKAVKCAEVWPTLEANGLKQDNFRGPAHRTFQGVLFPEGNNYLNLWNAFSDIKSHHEDFYPEDTCHVGPCPGDGTPPDAIVEDDESSLLIKESRLLGWLREFW